MNWNEVGKLDTALSNHKGKKLKFEIDSGKLVNTIDHVGESFEQQSNEGGQKIQNMQYSQHQKKVASDDSPNMHDVYSKAAGVRANTTNNTYDDSASGCMKGRHTKQLLNNIIQRQKSLEKLQAELDIADISNNLPLNRGLVSLVLHLLRFYRVRNHHHIGCLRMNIRICWELVGIKC